MKSVYRTLRAQFGVQICVADEAIEIATLSAPEGALLNQPAGTPVLKLERTGYDQLGRAVEYSVDLFRADRTRLHVRSQSPVIATADVTVRLSSRQRPRSPRGSRHDHQCSLAGPDAARE